MDQYKDRSKRPLALFQQRGGVVPAYAEKSFDPDSATSLVKFAAVAFADPANRAFPIHEPGAVFASAIYAVYHDAGEGVVGRIAKAAASHGICADLQHILDVLTPAAVTKVASATPSPDEIYALPAKRAYLINNPARFFDVGRKLEDDYGHIPMMDFADACKALTKAATKHNCLNRLAPKITRYGGDFIPDFSAAADGLIQRAGMVSGEFVSMYKEAAAVCRDAASLAAPLDDAETRDLVDFVSKLDKAAGLSLARLRSENMPDAFKLIFSDLTHDALDKKASVSFLIDGKVIPLAALQSIPAEIALKSFRRNVTDVLEKVAACSAISADLRADVDGLPPSVRQQLISLAVTYGQDHPL